MSLDILESEDVLDDHQPYAGVAYGRTARWSNGIEFLKFLQRRIYAFGIDASITWTRFFRKRRLRKPVVVNGVPIRIRNVVLGTTGLCNASCLSCPTGKAETAHVPRTPMPMPLFEKVVRSIAEHNIVIIDQLSFGLFGDGLVDPYVIERARLAKSLLPDARLVVNTNGAAYNPKRHASLLRYVTLIALHVESLIPETYNKLMAPLRAERVFAKIAQLMRDFPGRVLLSVPVSKFNVTELPTIRKFFLEKGAHRVIFDPLCNRCSESPEPFASMALNPVPIRCPSQVLDDLIVDCDGKVLVCCQDFRRQEPIGDLTKETLAEVMTNMQRMAMRKRFDEGRHTEMKTCSNCYADVRGKVHSENITETVERIRTAEAA